QLSALSSQLSAFSFQPSAFSSQLSAFSFELSALSCYLTTALDYATTNPGTSSSGWLGSEIVYSVVDNQCFAYDIFLRIVTSNAPFGRGKTDLTYTIGIYREIADVPFVVAVSIPPFPVRLVGRIPVSSC